jgi:hypothetical protein
MKTFIAICFCGLSISASAQMKYSGTKFGVSFQYPRGYVLKEGVFDKNKDTGMGYLGPVPMDFVAPGGVRVATIGTPTGSYPGTDFVNAFFTVSVNRYLTNAECEQFADDFALASRKKPVKKISGVNFQGIRIGTAGLGHQFSGAYYHGFSGGYCYELGYGVATAGYGAVDGMKHVDSAEVFSILEKVLGTVMLRIPARGAASSPSTQAFAIAPLGSPSNSDRVSWNVEGVQAEASLAAHPRKPPEHPRSMHVASLIYCSRGTTALRQSVMESV